LSLPLNTNVSSIHLISAIIIRHSIFCTFQVIFSLLHIISNIFLHFIKAVVITSSDFHCINTLGTLCITCVKAIHNGHHNTALVIEMVVLYLTAYQMQLET
jgi:hypothetical protein